MHDIGYNYNHICVYLRWDLEGNSAFNIYGGDTYNFGCYWFLWNKLGDDSMDEEIKPAEEFCEKEWGKS